jgi:two-component system, chemotaxis family, protein-glutamate methylesterase/glutaminase
MPSAESQTIERAPFLERVRVLLVDDSAVARAALSRIIGDDPSMEVVGAVGGAFAAIDWLKSNQSDIILLDIQMPGIDGLTALPELMTVSGAARILIVSTLATAGARASIKALTLGATDVLAKPSADGLGRQFGMILLDRIRRLSQSSSPQPPAKLSTPRFVRRSLPDTPIACLGIGSSTGGLHALIEFFSNLLPDFDAPILLTQHLPPSFMPLFAEQMAQASGRQVQVAMDAMPLHRGTVLVAPGDAHLTVVIERGRALARLNRDEVSSRCLPSVDRMLASIAKSFGAGGMAVILTGMGRDGAEGAEMLADAGGTIIVQDEQSSAVWGMPGAVAKAGHSSLIARPSRLAAHVSQCGVVA